jgi:hypothetical protein
VTQFVVPDSHIQKFEPHIVGSHSHVEFWIPAEELVNLNSSIQRLIAVKGAFFGTDFKGWIPGQLLLRGKDVIKQFVIMSKTWDYNWMDFVLEVSANRKTLFQNFLFWHSSISLHTG